MYNSAQTVIGNHQVYRGSCTTTTYILCLLLTATSTENVEIMQPCAPRNVLQATLSKVLF